MPRHSPCALISLTIFLVLRKNYAGHRSFSISRSNCSFTHNSTKKSVCFAFPAKHPLLPCLLSHHFSIVQFSRCRLRSKTGSKHLNTFKCFDPFSGGDNRNRTDDLLLAKQALSQLSYAPGPTQSSMRRTCIWWVLMDSNHRPPPYQDDALTS